MTPPLPPPSGTLTPADPPPDPAGHAPPTAPVGSHAAAPSGSGGAPESSSAGTVVRTLGPAALLAGFAAFLPPLGSIVLFWHINDVGAWLRGHDGLGVAAYVGAFTLLAGLALLPTYASAILGGWAFGFATGFPAALAGFFGASLVGYAVSRPTASARVSAVLRGQARWQAVRDALVGGSPLKTFLIVTLLRVPPNSPFALTNLVLASVRVPAWIYAPATLVGMAPRTGVAVFLADQVRDQMVAEAARQTPMWLVAGGIILSIAVLLVLGAIAKRGLDRLTAVPPRP